MKILYAAGDYLEAGHQILAFPAKIGDKLDMPIEKDIANTVPEVKQSIENMYAENPHYEVVPPQLGDVVWTQTSGSKWYAHCIVYDEAENFNYDAFVLCMKSIKKKSIELDHDQIGMPLRWFDKKVLQENWHDAFVIIEKELGDSNKVIVHDKCQAFVYDQDKDFLFDVISSLPGAKKAYYSEVQIKFRNL